jgi:hypothetical protein
VFTYIQLYINLKNTPPKYIIVYRGQQTPSCSNTSHDHYNTKNNENVILSFDHRLDKGVLIADIYICTTVYINLKNIPPREPRGIEIGPSFSAEDF